MRKKGKLLFQNVGFHIESESNSVFDLVCGMEILRKEVENISLYNNRMYYFCSKHCKEHFDKNPERYVA